MAQTAPAPAAPTGTPQIKRTSIARDVSEDDTLSNLDEVDAPSVKATNTRKLPPMVDMSETEYNTTRAALSLVAMVKKVMASEVEDEKDRMTYLAQQLRAHEIQIWDQLAKKYGFESVEDAQLEGLSFKLKTGHFVQVYRPEQPQAVDAKA